MGLLDLFGALTIWNSAYEAAPDGSASISLGDDAIRELKSSVRERLTKEHTMNLTSGLLADDGWHRQGSAKAYVQSTAPVYRPDGSTSLTSDDIGRLWIDNTDTTYPDLYVYMGTTLGWVLIRSRALRLTAPTTIIAGDIYYEAT